MKIQDIKTKRLNIRSYEVSDKDFVISIWNDPETGKYMPDPSIEHMDESYREVYDTLNEDEDCSYLISELLETGEAIGTCSFVVCDNGKTFDLGYCVHMKHWQKGYATEMAEALIAYAKSCGANTVKAPVNKLNEPSNAVLRKLGFEVVGESKFKKMGTDILMETYLYQLSV